MPDGASSAAANSKGAEPPRCVAATPGNPSSGAATATVTATATGDDDDDDGDDDDGDDDDEVVTYRSGSIASRKHSVPESHSTP